LTIIQITGWINANFYQGNNIGMKKIKKRIGHRMVNIGEDLQTWCCVSGLEDTWLESLAEWLQKKGEKLYYNN
jgi:uncharacterized phage-like protein YoqJ